MDQPHEPGERDYHEAMALERYEETRRWRDGSDIVDLADAPCQGITAVRTNGIWSVAVKTTDGWEFGEHVTFSGALKAALFTRRE